MAPLMTASEVKLFKWVGSKQAVIDQILPHLQAEPILRFVEPMCGSAVASLQLSAGGLPCVLGDRCKRLVNTLEVVRGDPSALIEQVRRMAVWYDAGGSNKKAVFLNWRAAMNLDEPEPIRAAALFLLVNRTAFNGLYRENRHGEFNVSWGKKTSCAVDTIVQGIEFASPRLQNAMTAVSDFSALCFPVPGDCWFFDPPYDAAFSGYGGSWHPEKDLLRLANFARRVVSCGGRAFVCNNDTPRVRAAFPGSVFHAITGNTCVSQANKSRGSTTELLIEVRLP